MKKLGDTISPFSMGLIFLYMLPTLFVVFRPSLRELGLLYAVDVGMFFVVQVIDSRLLVPKLFPRSKLYFPSANFERIAAVPATERRAVLDELVGYPLKRAISASVASALKVIPAICIAAFVWDHGQNPMIALSKAAAIAFILISYFYGAVFYENHRAISDLIATIHMRFDWSVAIRDFQTTHSRKDLTRHEIVNLMSIWIFMLWLLSLIALDPRPGHNIVVEIALVMTTAMMLAAHIWKLGRRNFIEPLMGIFNRFESFDPRTGTTMLPPDSNPLLARFAAVVNELADRLRIYEGELAHAVFKETEKSRFRALGQLSALIAHDLSAPLHVLRFCVDAMANDSKLAKDPRYLQQLVGNSARATELVESLKAYLKNPENRAGGSYFWKSHRNVLRILQLQYEQKSFMSVRIETFNDIDDVVLGIAQQDLIHVLMNLYRNAFDNMIHHGVSPAILRVGLLDAGADDCITALIEDAGTGLSAEAYEKMTGADALSQFGRERMPGLGLRLVRRLVEQHGGTLDIVEKNDSTPGTCFSLRLPRQPHDATKALAASALKDVLFKPDPDLGLQAALRLATRSEQNE